MTNPATPLTKEQVSKDYKAYPPTMEGGLEGKPYHEHRIAPIFYEIPLGSKVLDVGSNDGEFMALLKEKRQCDVYGIDLSEKATAIAKAKGLNVQVADAENIPFPDKSFDVVCLLEVLSHVFDPEKAISEIKRVLTPKGILLGSVPHKNLETYLWDDRRLHRRYYDATELEVALNKFFDATHIRVLTGGQLAFSMSQSFLADQPAEILFKCGQKRTPGWDSALLDRSILRAWFGPSQGTGTVYFRMKGFFDKMQKMGAETFYDPYNEEDNDSAAQWTRKITWTHVQNQLENILRAADLSIWQITSSWHCLAFFRTIRDPKCNTNRPFVKPFITEIDDWLFDLPSYNIASGPYQPNSDLEKLAYKQIELSDAVICSTDYIQKSICELFPEKPVYVVPNCIDFDVWDNLSKTHTLSPKEDGVIRIGYTGCGNHTGDMEVIKRPLLALLEEFPNLEIIMPSALLKPFEETKSNRIFFADWVPINKYPGMLYGWNIDIGIAPLRDTTFNCAKSNLRWLEYSALKVPTVASSVYPFKTSIHHQKDGVLTSNSQKSWYEAIKALIVDKETRAKIGQAAYTRVKKEWDMDRVSRTYLSILKTIKGMAIPHAAIRTSNRNRAASR